MRSLVIGLLLVLTYPCAVTAQEKPQFPYEATVDQDGAYVRSGQGKNYYPTGRLRKGDKVTVRRHDPGGWYMIEPPAGSFSWIPAEQVKKEAADRGTVTVNNAVVRVGSFESDIHDFFQQKLSQGDEVRILGEKMLADEKQPAKLWYKIAPPRNEFRWIEGRALLPVKRPGTSSGPTGGDPFEQGYSGPLRKNSTKTPTPKIAETSPATSAGNTPNPIYDQPAKGEGLVERPLVRRETKPRAGDAVAQSGSSRSELDTQRQELDRLDARFRAILAQDFVQWEFADLERDYVDLRDRVTHPTYERLIDGKLTSIQNYKKIKAEQDEFLRITAETNQRDAELVAQQQRYEAKFVRKEITKFDGAGIVQRATNPRPGAPQHVLLAPNGRVLAYLQAQPGVNLDAWLGRAVGLTGPRTARPELGSDLIIVTGVTPVKLAP